MTIDFQLGRPAADARIVVAMSGGVDSSVVAALAAKTGAEVIGVTLQLYDHGEAVKRSGSCCAGQDIYDAKTVCDRLGIAHYVLDYESRFRTGVIDRFADEYAQGRTPVPCSLCNQGVKFTDLKTRMVDQGMSLGQALQDVKKTANVTAEVTKAEAEADAMIKSSTTSTTSTTTTPTSTKKTKTKSTGDK